MMLRILASETKTTVVFTDIQILRRLANRKRAGKMTAQLGRDVSKTEVEPMVCLVQGTGVLREDLLWRYGLRQTQRKNPRNRYAPSRRL